MSKWNLGQMAAKLSGDGELRAHENRTIQFQMINGQLVGNNKSSGGGLSARIFDAGAWGFASVPEISLAAADRVLMQAGRNASVLSKRVERFDTPFLRANAKGSMDYSTKKPRISSQDVIGF